MKVNGSSVRFATTGAVSARATSDETAIPSDARQSPPSTSVTSAAGIRCG